MIHIYVGFSITISVKNSILQSKLHIYYGRMSISSPPPAAQMLRSSAVRGKMPTNRYGQTPTIRYVLNIKNYNSLHVVSDSMV